MVRVQTDHFDLGQICRSGQCFRMRRLEAEPGDRYEIVAGERYLEVVQREKECEFLCDREEFDGFWRDYFDLDEDYGRFIRQINPEDTYLTAAAAAGRGIRILRQDLWEMTVSFLISQQNNIPRIRRCIENLCREYGQRHMTPEGGEYWGFPKPQALAELGEDELKACNLGYRSRYVVRTAKMVSSGELDLERVRDMPYQKAREELLKVFGAGEKVADCICLFALHHLEAFPVDTHIRQAVESHYKGGFPVESYRGIEGVLQQYIFYHELHGDKTTAALR